MTPEAKTKKKVRAILDAEEVYHFNPFGGGYGRAGIPDIVGCVNGFFLAVECKAGKGKTTALQDRELESIRHAGGVAPCCLARPRHPTENLLEVVSNRGHNVWQRTKR